MGRNVNQKLKLLYLLKILSEKTDEEHRLTSQMLIRELEAYDIKAERKSIYDDIDCLCRFGFDIVTARGRSDGGYYMASREFELPELKLLVDAVQASRFITRKKSRELIAKIEKLAGPYEGKQLQRQVFVAGRIKTENESIYYNVDRIYKAIQDNTPVTFTYLEWNLHKELQPRRMGKEYRVSPWALVWQDENYYLIAYDDTEEKIKHFRVDKMSRITQLGDQKRKGMEVFGELDIGEYTNRTFGMFGGESQIVTLKLPESMIGIILDRFGRNVAVRRGEKDSISVRIKAAVSGQFFGWLTGLGPGVSIVSPEPVRKSYLDFLNNIMENYKGKEKEQKI